MSRYGLSGRQDKTENCEPRKCSARAYRCVRLPPLFFVSPDGIDDNVLLRDVEGTLYVSNTARKVTGKLGSRSATPADLVPLLPFHCHVSPIRPRPSFVDDAPPERQPRFMVRSHRFFLGQRLPYNRTYIS